MNATRNDLIRLGVVTAAEAVCLVGAALGSGRFGGPAVAEAGGGALAADATLLAPGGPAFAIWSVVYLGLLAYTVWQWLPEQRAADRHRQVGWWIAASMLLNAVWLGVVRQGWLVASAVVIVVLVLVLGVIVARLARHRPTGRADLVITDGTFGVYTGWVSVAVCANITAVLVDAGVDLGAGWNQVAAVAVLAVAGAVGVLLALRTGANLAIAGALAWGLAWIAVERTTGAPSSTVTAVAAAAIAALVVVVFVALAFRGENRTTARPAS